MILMENVKEIIINGKIYFNYRNCNIITEDDSMDKAKTFECGLNKMSFTGKCDKDIKKVLDMFGGDWTETTKIKDEMLECMHCGNIIRIPREEYLKMREHADFLSEKLRGYDGDNIHIGGIITMIDEVENCCSKPDYRRL